jgi:hypothetical protein
VDYHDPVHHDTRRAIAWIVHVLETGRAAPAFDALDGRTYAFAGQATYEGVQMLGDDASLLTGPLTALFNTRNSDYVSLALNGSRFGGLDQRAGEPFHGLIDGRAVTIFDGGERYDFAFGAGAGAS